MAVTGWLARHSCSSPIGINSDFLETTLCMSEFLLRSAEAATGADDTPSDRAENDSAAGIPFTNSYTRAQLREPDRRRDGPSRHRQLLAIKSHITASEVSEAVCPSPALGESPLAEEKLFGSSKRSGGSCVACYGYCAYLRPIFASFRSRASDWRFGANGKGS